MTASRPNQNRKRPKTKGAKIKTIQTKITRVRTVTLGVRKKPKTAGKKPWHKPSMKKLGIIGSLLIVTTFAIFAIMHYVEIKDWWNKYFPRQNICATSKPLDLAVPTQMTPTNNIVTNNASLVNGIEPASHGDTAPQRNILPATMETVPAKTLENIVKMFVDAIVAIKKDTEVQALPQQQSQQIDVDAPTDGALKRFELPTPQALNKIAKYGCGTDEDVLAPYGYVYYPLKKGYVVLPDNSTAISIWYNDTPINQYRPGHNGVRGIKWIKIKSNSPYPERYSFRITPAPTPY